MTLKKSINGFVVLLLSIAVYTGCNFLGRFDLGWLSVLIRVVVYFLLGMVLNRYHPGRFNLFVFAALPLLSEMEYLISEQLDTAAYIARTGTLILTLVALFTGYGFFRMPPLVKLGMVVFLLAGPYITKLLYVPYLVPQQTATDRTYAKLIGKSFITYLEGTDLRNVQNTTVSKDIFTNKVTLVEFYRKSCRPCRDKEPALHALRDLYRNKDFQVVYVDAGNHDSWETFLKQTENENRLYDTRDKLILNLGVNGMPHEFILDKKGVIRHTHVGYGGEEAEDVYINATKSKIESLLHEKS